MPTCPRRGIQRVDLSTACRICGYKPADAKSKPVSAAPQPPVPGTQPQARAPAERIGNRHYKVKIASAVIVLLVAYVSSPYISLHRFYSAMKRADAEDVSSHIDFPSLRTSIKEQFKAYRAMLMADNSKATDSLFGSLVATWELNAIDSMVDAVVTPSGVTAIFRASRSNMAEGWRRNPLLVSVQGSAHNLPIAQ